MELQDLLDLINNFIKVFNDHTHTVPSGTFVTKVTGGSGAPAVGVPNTGTEKTNKPGKSVDEIKPDDVLY